jgi:hypothetical protein
MIGLRVGVEVEAPRAAVATLTATLPWMAPERIQLDDHRILLLLSTSFDDATEACAYAKRRIRKSAVGMGLDIAIVSTEAFPPTIDLRDSTRAERRTDRS